MLCIAADPGIRLRDIAAVVGITERSAYGIVTDLTTAGYVIKERDGRRNRYHVQAHLPLGDPITRERTIGDLLDVLLGNPQDTSRAFAPVKAPRASPRRRTARR